MEKPPPIKEADPVNTAMFADDAALATRRFEYLVQRRDQMLDKIRFGLLALNGASIVALMSALGGDGEAAKWIGFTPEIAKYSAIAFVLGVVLAAVAIMIESNLHRTEAGDAEARRSTLSRLQALREAPFDHVNHQRAGDVMREYHELKLVDFQWSAPAITLQNASGGLWLFGICLPLLKSLNLDGWFHWPQAAWIALTTI